MTHDTKHMPAEACSEFLTDDTPEPEMDQGPEMLGRALIYAIVVVSLISAWVVA